MSHSKMTKSGRSLYIEKWNPKARKYINTCVICGCKGYSPSIDSEKTPGDMERRAICDELKKTLKVLPLDELGRCVDCAKRIDK